MFFVYTKPAGRKLRRSAISQDYRDANVFEKFHSHNVFPPLENEKSAFSNSSGLKNVLELKAEFSPRISVNGRCNHFPA